MTVSSRIVSFWGLLKGDVVDLLFQFFHEKLLFSLLASLNGQLLHFVLDQLTYCMLLDYPR